MVGGFDGEGGEVEVMITGEVRYTMKEGGGEEVEVEWAAHGRVVREGEGGWRFGGYRVWL